VSSSHTGELLNHLGLGSNLKDRSLSEEKVARELEC